MKDTRYLNIILTLLTIVMALNLAVSWSRSPDMLPQAHAQGIPDEGAQRNQIIEQLKSLNKKTEDIRDLMVSGRLHVTITAPPAREQE